MAGFSISRSAQRVVTKKTIFKFVLMKLNFNFALF